jgi:alpha-beta hydrolase superfamily lysophospholipase
MAKKADSYPLLDRPEVSTVLFHPRREPLGWPPPTGTRDLAIPVADGVSLGARFHSDTPEAPTLLFFHGNGEIVADYDDIGQAYARAGINFLVVDYRGYGRSDGQATASSMLADSRRVFNWFRQWRRAEGHTGPLAVMGRSLGSAAALELAATEAKAIGALLIESGFAHTGPLLRTLGAAISPQELRRGEGFRQLAKIASFAGPLLIIHAEQDHLIPWSEGEALFKASPSLNKEMLTITGANHNDIFLRAWPTYLSAVSRVLNTCQTDPSPPL